MQKLFFYYRDFNLKVCSRTLTRTLQTSNFFFQRKFFSISSKTNLKKDGYSLVEFFNEYSAIAAFCTWHEIVENESFKYNVAIDFLTIHNVWA